MKHIALLFITICVLASCRKNREPDLADKFVGDYYDTKTTAGVTSTETWKITKQDLNHVNVTFFFMNTYPDGSVARSKYDIYIPDVIVSEANVLDFNNRFTTDQLEYYASGKAQLVNNTLDYDIVLKSGYNTSKLSNKIQRR